MVKGICNLCGNKMAVEIIPCGKTAFLEAECSECNNAVDLIITAETGRELTSSNRTIGL